MSGLAHYLEDEGLATIIVALVREHIVSMRPPRALWVPFELGRPFAEPNQPDLQRQILKAALALLDKPVSSPLLQDFTEQPPYQPSDTNWFPPGELDNNSATAEALSLLPAWRKAQARTGKSTVGISDLAPEVAVEYIERYLTDNPMPNPKGMAAVSRVRFAVDDTKAFYTEAAISTGGHPSSVQLQDWFWKQTLAGAMIRDFQDIARLSDDKNLRLISNSLVPAEHTVEHS